jgi:hypothetical protein
MAVRILDRGSNEPHLEDRTVPGVQFHFDPPPVQIRHSRCYEGWAVSYSASNEICRFLSRQIWQDLSGKIGRA